MQWESSFVYIDDNFHVVFRHWDSFLVYTDENFHAVFSHSMQWAVSLSILNSPTTYFKGVKRLKTLQQLIVWTSPHPTLGSYLNTN